MYQSIYVSHIHRVKKGNNKKKKEEKLLEKGKEATYALLAHSYTLSFLWSPFTFLNSDFTLFFFFDLFFPFYFFVVVFWNFRSVSPPSLSPLSFLSLRFSQNILELHTIISLSLSSFVIIVCVCFNHGFCLDCDNLFLGWCRKKDYVKTFGFGSNGFVKDVSFFFSVLRSHDSKSLQSSFPLVDFFIFPILILFWVLGLRKA